MIANAALVVAKLAGEAPGIGDCRKASVAEVLTCAVLAREQEVPRDEVEAPNVA